MNIKTITLTALCSILICTASARAAEVMIDFTLESGGGLNDNTMTTSATGITSDIVWSSTHGPCLGDHSQYYMQNIIDGYIATSPYQNYWMPDGNHSGGEPGTNVAPLQIIFSQPVYITKIRTYNFISNSGRYLARWAESIFSVSYDGVNFVDQTAIEIDDNPDYTDYVDIYINDYVMAIDYQPSLNPDHGIPDYYAINEIQMFTDDDPPPVAESESVPEPASIVLLLTGCAGLVRRLKR